jgi:iron(III) transport system ATP-binding protein
MLFANKLSAGELSADKQAPLAIYGLHKSFGSSAALSGIDLRIEKGQVLALLGPSGCGKTTLLRCIAGLLTADAGTIEIQGKPVATNNFSLPPEQRGLGMVFQDYALWPHMTVAENLAFPLRMGKHPKAEQQARIDWALDLVGLSAMAKRSPGTLSGGQQQRVALARAIVSRPTLLLMDEPLSNLDKSLRLQLALEIRGLIDNLGLTAVFVTHDQHEAFALADQVAVMQGGKIAQLTPPEQLFSAPSTPAIAEFLDAGSLIDAELTAQGLRLGQCILPVTATPQVNGAIKLLIPRTALSINAKGELHGQICSRVYLGDHYAAEVQLNGGTRLKLQLSTCPGIGSKVGLSLATTQLHAWASDMKALTLRPLTEMIAESA